MSPKTRIVHVVSGLSMGGVSNMVFDLLKNCKSSNYEYLLVNLSGQGDESVVARLLNIGVRIENIPYEFQKGYSLIDYFKEAFFYGKNRNQVAFDTVKSLKPDMLHFHTLPRELLFGKRVAKATGCELVYTDHTARIRKKDGSVVTRFLIRFPFMKFYSNCHVVAVSNPVLDYIRFFNIDRFVKSVQVVINKINANPFRISYMQKPELKVVYVSRILKAKGHYELIQAWALLPPLGIHLYLIGPDELNGDLQKIVAELNVSNPVTFTGGVPNAVSLIEDADFAVFPSHQEGLPLALLEKMQIGLPCIVSDIPELKSIVTDLENGLVFPVGDVVALANRITTLAKDIKLRSILGTAAADHVERFFVSKMGGIDKEYEEVYRKLLANQGHIDSQMEL